MTYPLTLILMPWGRVGSNMVLNAIAHFHKADVYNEMLTRIATMYASEPLPVIAAHQADWLAQHATRATLKRPTVVNHAALSTADPQGFVDWMERESPQIITLDRHDDLSVALSSARVAAWVAEGAARGEKRNWAIQTDVDFRPDIDPAVVRKNLESVSKGRAMLYDLVGSQSHLALYYEDLILDLDGCMSDILRRVGVARNPFRISSRKFGGSDLHKLVGNPQDIAGIVAEHAGRTVITA
tara:strand:- start:485 stop:1207 length:723 start_codon:yes stop_codon:yes gene_type:complete